MFRFVLAISALLMVAACEEKPEYEVIGTQGVMKAIGISDASADDPNYYEEVIEAECRDDDVCILIFFMGLSSVRFPMSDAELAARTAQYNRNQSTGLDRIVYACGGLIDGKAGDCF